MTYNTLFQLCLLYMSILSTYSYSGLNTGTYSSHFYGGLFSYIYPSNTSHRLAKKYSQTYMISQNSGYPKKNIHTKQTQSDIASTWTANSINDDDLNRLDLENSFKHIQGYTYSSHGATNVLIPNSRQSIKPVVVGIAGGSGSGKTTLAKAVVKILGEEHVTFISHDSYYKDLSGRLKNGSHYEHINDTKKLECLSMEERSQVNFDHPDSLDTALLETHIRQLKQGFSVQVPIYDFKTHSRTSNYQLVTPRPIVIVDGILLFAEQSLLKEFDMKIFVDTDDDIRLIRRLQRDVAERQRTVESVIDQYISTVRPMHQLYVEPSKRKADIIVPAGQGIQAVALDMCVSRLREIINFYQ